MDNEQYFTRIRGDYQKAVEACAEGYRNIAAHLDGLLRGRVIDFGNGGVINYSIDRIDRLSCVDLINHESPSRQDKVEFIKGDFYAFDFPPDTDFVLVQFLLHHLPEDERLKTALRALNRALGSRGRLIVVEALMPRYMEWVQNALRPVLFWLLRVIGKPGLRFFSRGSLSQVLEDAGFRQLRFHRIDVGRRIAPASALFPSLTIPGRLYPLQWVVVEASAGPG